MRQANPSGGERHRPPPLDLALVVGVTPGWTLALDGDEPRSLTVRQAVEHAAGIAGTRGAVQVLDATRATLDALPIGTAAQLNAELASAAVALLADVRGGLDALADVLDGVDRATADCAPPPAEASPDLMGALFVRIDQGRERARRLRRRVDAGGGPLDRMAAALRAAR